MLDLWGNEVDDLDDLDEKHKSLSFFDCVNCIQFRKDITPELINVYNPFMVNKSFQQNQISVEVANIMNGLSILPKEVQFKFYKLMFPRGLGKSKWTKKTVDKKFDKLLNLGYTIQDIESILYIMNDEQINIISKRTKEA